MTRFFKSCYESLLVPLGLLYWAVAGLTITVIGAVLYSILPKKYSRPCGRFLLQKAFLFFIAYLKISRFVYLDDSALTRLADYKGAAIIAPNHIALWDAVFIIAKIPETICIMKGAILRNPFLGGGARLAGYIANDSSGQMIRAASQQLLQGEKLLLFPEGTRTKTDAQWLNAFQGATALIAKRTKVPIFPVYIRSNSRFYEKGWALFKKPVFPIRLSFEVGEAVYFSENDDLQSFTEKLQQSYTEVLARPHPLRRKQHSGL
ncbi:MAG: 1-acyl-sn-glycerol-3-phosphate acyltransferase [Methylococcaceae bacterium]|nr:1-acyl-sn-glycerol-3-phosphate acyltransferase [Methylococcaceae bacterium]